MKLRVVVLVAWSSLIANGCHAFSIPSSSSLSSSSSFSSFLRASVSDELRATSSSNGYESRRKRVSAFRKWAEDRGVKVGGLTIDVSADTGGLGLFADRDLKSGDLLVSVPTSAVITSDVADDGSSSSPWWARLSRKINAVDGPWKDVLPSSFDTPLHWDDLSGLQYPFLERAVERQRTTWRTAYDESSENDESGLSYADFVWGCECARSRAFSGDYQGSTFDAKPYAFLSLLVATYVGLHLGTLEQAANGAAVALCGFVWKDFVLPKLSSKGKGGGKKGGDDDGRTYVVCPLVDMANHVGTGDHAGEVALEYFTDSYSLAVRDGASLGKGGELLLSYGERDNDQLLQYYGFVERDNPHDVYVMPPLGEWDLAAMEDAVGRRGEFGRAGRLSKLQRAGLLGGEGVVVSRRDGVDPAALAALRALASTDDEWTAAGEAVGNFAAAPNPDNERRARVAAAAALEAELATKPTTFEEDAAASKRANAPSSLATMEERSALAFRLEKKRVLREAIDALRST